MIARIRSLPRSGIRAVNTTALMKALKREVERDSKTRIETRWQIG